MNFDLLPHLHCPLPPFLVIPVCHFSPLFVCFGTHHYPWQPLGLVCVVCRMLASCSQCGETSVDTSRCVVSVAWDLAVHGGHMMRGAWIAYLLFFFFLFIVTRTRELSLSYLPFSLSVVCCQRVLSVTACL